MNELEKKINGVYCENMPCCGIFAAALASNKEPQEVFDAYKAMCNKTSRWKGRTDFFDLERLMINVLGVAYWEVEGVMGMTVRKFYDEYCEPSKTYIVRVSGHIMTIDKGRLIDQWHCDPVNEAKKNRCRVKGAIEILTPTNIPEGKISGTRTKEAKVADHEAKAKAEREQAAKMLWKGMAKYGLTNKRVAEHQEQKIKLVGYNSSKSRRPFVVEVIEKNGNPCSVFAETSVYSVAVWFGIENHSLEYAA
tara:strand:- start:49 stop:798 length:750 start_codon:yes stop_codon:yes gene_type:complete